MDRRMYLKSLACTVGQFFICDAQELRWTWLTQVVHMVGTKVIQ